MAKKKPADSDQPGDKPKRYPSRDRVKYPGIPIALHQWLESYAKKHSGEYDKKSVSWAARKAIAYFKRVVETEGDPYESAP